MKYTTFLVFLMVAAGCASPRPAATVSAEPDIAALKTMPLADARRILEQRAKRRWDAVDAEVKKELDRTSARVRELNETKTPDQRYILSEEQKRIMADFRTFEKGKKEEELRQIRRELHVQLNELMNEDAEQDKD